MARLEGDVPIGALRSLVDAMLTPFRMLARIPSNVISSPRRMLGLSLPMRSALLLFFCLLTMTIVWALTRFWLEDRARLDTFYWRELPMIGTLVVLIPIISWYSLKLWLEGEPSPHPDIDAVWSKTLKTLGEHSIDLADVPIFIVLGPPDVASADRLLTSSALSFPVRVPAGQGPLQIYASSEGIYISCGESSCVGRLLGERVGTLSQADGPAGGGAVNIEGTMPLSQGGVMPRVGGEAFGGDQTPGFFGGPVPGSLTKTEVFTGPPNAGAPPGAIPSIRAHPAPPTATMGQPGGGAPPPPAAGGGIFGTMDVGGNPAVAAGTPVQPLASSAVAIDRLDPSEFKRATSQLMHLCRCIRRQRDPLCPINGILVATPFKVLADGNQEVVNQLQTAIKSDLATLRSVTRIRCSVTHLIADMDEEAGFRELIRRVDAARTRSQRFGKGFGLWNVPTRGQLEAVVKHACGAFEDWSYLLFREEDGLSKRGNRHLYGLLCRIRSTFAPRLTHLIQSTYAIRDDESTPLAREPFLFSGCYFAANGLTPDRQAFSRGVFSKLRTEEEELEWGSEAEAEERRMQTAVQVLLILNGILIAAIAGMLFYSYQFQGR